MLGGKIGPTVADEAVTAPAKEGSKPRFFMASISMRPSPPISASAAPDMPEKIRLPKMFTCASPPGARSTAVLAKRKMRSVMNAHAAFGDEALVDRRQRGRGGGIGRGKRMRAVDLRTRHSCFT